MSVHDAVTALRAERAALTARLAIVERVLTDLDTLFVVDEATAAATPTPPPATRAVRPAAAGAHVCDVCGHGFNRANGLSRHLHQTHGLPRRTLRATTPPPPPDPPDLMDTTLVLRCSQCGWDTNLADDAITELTKHCRTEHNRSPHDRERRPRAPRRLPALAGNGQSDGLEDIP
jgi:hypothetical protein